MSYGEGSTLDTMNAKAQDNELDIEILLDAEALPREIAAVEAVAQKEGIRGSVRAAFFRKSLGDLPWVIYLLAPVLVFCSAFLKGAGQEAGRDTYQALRGLVERLYHARRNRHGGVIVRDSDTFTEIVLQDDLPEEAYRQLAQMGPKRLEGGYWVWDSEQNRWHRT